MSIIGVDSVRIKHDNQILMFPSLTLVAASIVYNWPEPFALLNALGPIRFGNSQSLFIERLSLSVLTLTLVESG